MLSHSKRPGAGKEKASAAAGVDKTLAFLSAPGAIRTRDLRFRNSLRLPYAFLMLTKTPDFPGFSRLQPFHLALPKRRKRALVGGLVGGLFQSANGWKSRRARRSCQSPMPPFNCTTTSSRDRQKTSSSVSASSTRFHCRERILLHQDTPKFLPPADGFFRHGSHRYELNAQHHSTDVKLALPMLSATTERPFHFRTLSKKRCSRPVRR